MKTKFISASYVDDLDSIRFVPRGSRVVVILKNDIDYNNPESYKDKKVYYKEGSSFKPITREGISVIIYGRGHKIENLSVNSYLGNTGMFSKLENLYLRNVSFDNMSVKGRVSVGGVVGEVTGKLDVKTSGFSGNVEGESFVGGIAGVAEDVSITGSTSITEIKGEEFVGGVVGLVRHINYDDTAIYSQIDSVGSLTGRYYGMATDDKILKRTKK